MPVSGPDQGNCLIVRGLPALLQLAHEGLAGKHRCHGGADRVGPDHELLWAEPPRPAVPWPKPICPSLAARPPTGREHPRPGMCLVGSRQPRAHRSDCGAGPEGPAPSQVRGIWLGRASRTRRRRRSAPLALGTSAKMVRRFNVLTCETEGSVASRAKPASLVALAPVSSRTKATTSSAKSSSGVLVPRLGRGHRGQGSPTRDGADQGLVQSAAPHPLLVVGHDPALGGIG